MANLQEIDLIKLKRVKDIRGKIKEFFSDEEITDLAKNKIVPHYIVYNPVTKVETYGFIQGELTDWLLNNCIEQGKWNYEQKLSILRFDYAGYQIDHYDNIPPELVRIKSLYKFPVGEQSFTPPVIYFLCNNGRIVYVGQSTNILSRIQSHIAEKCKKFTDVFFIPCHRNLLNKFEASFIKHLNPEYNDAQPGRSYPDELVKEVIDLLSVEESKN